MPTNWQIRRGLLGFPEFTSPTFTPIFDDDPSYGVLRDGSGAEFVVAAPGVFFPDLTIDVPDPVVAQLGISSPADAQVWVVLTQGAGGWTANLRGPLVVHAHTGEAAQVVLDDQYPTAAELAA